MKFLILSAALTGLVSAGGLALIPLPVMETATKPLVSAAASDNGVLFELAEVSVFMNHKSASLFSRSLRPAITGFLEKIPVQTRNWEWPTFVRRRGQAPEDSGDLVQEFFARMLGQGWLCGVKHASARYFSLFSSASSPANAAVLLRKSVGEERFRCPSN